MIRKRFNRVSNENSENCAPRSRKLKVTRKWQITRTLLSALANWFRQFVIGFSFSRTSRTDLNPRNLTWMEPLTGIAHCLLLFRPVHCLSSATIFIWLLCCSVFASAGIMLRLFLLSFETRSLFQLSLSERSSADRMLTTRDERCEKNNLRKITGANCWHLNVFRGKPSSTEINK